MTDTTLEIANKLVQQLRNELLAAMKPAETGEETTARLLTVADAARYIARSESAVRHLISNRELPVIRVGRNVRVDRQDLDRWIESNRCD